jgi:hypothetical protein
MNNTTLQQAPEDLGRHSAGDTTDRMTTTPGDPLDLCIGSSVTEPEDGNESETLLFRPKLRFADEDPAG